MALATRRKPSAHQKKRHAHHHRRSKPYMKTYLPYLPMLLVVGLALVINAVWTHTGVLGVQQDFTASTLLQATNTQRANYNAPALTLDPQLTAAAQAKAADMASLNYWSHTSPSGQTPWTLVTESGYQYQAAGENLAYGFDSANATIAGWMSSPEHRDNLLSANYQQVGFGVAQAADFQGHGPTTIIVAEYAQPPVGTISPASPANMSGAELATQHIARVQILTGSQANWGLLAIIAIAGGGFALLLIRHSRRWHRVLVKGEAFVAHHPFLDILITVVVVAGVLLTRQSGVVH